MIPVGTIVKAKAGRDKEGFFVVVKSEEGWVYIADGKRRKVENPTKGIYIIDGKKVLVK